MQHEFDILEAFDKKTKKNILQTVREQWRQFKSKLTSKWTLPKGTDDDDETMRDKHGINKDK